MKRRSEKRKTRKRIIRRKERKRVGGYTEKEIRNIYTKPNRVYIDIGIEIGAGVGYRGVISM